MMRTPGTILVVDDIEDVRFLVSALLRSSGYECLAAANGVEALDVLKDHPEIRLVITDYDMPGMDGLELTRQIRRDERFEDLPILMQSAFPLDRLESPSEAAGVTRLLPKPISTRTLQLQIHSILETTPPGHVWRALLVGLPALSATIIRSTLSDAGFQILEVSDEAQARSLLQRVDGIDLAFVNHPHPDYGEFIRAHLLRSEKDFHLFRLVLLMGAALPQGSFKEGPVCVAGYLMNPVNPEKVSALLRRLGLSQIHGRA